MKALPPLFFFLFSFSAQAALLMKPGKWRIETLVKRDNKGHLLINPIPKMNEAMKTMTPAELERIKNKKVPEVAVEKEGITVCYTKEMLESGLDIKKNQEAHNCRIYNQKSGPTLVSMNFRCRNGTTGRTEWKVINETQLTGVTKTVTNQGKKSQMNFKADYLSADCTR